MWEVFAVLVSANYIAEEIACKNYGKEHRETAPALLSLGLAGSWDVLQQEEALQVLDLIYVNIRKYVYIIYNQNQSRDRKNTSRCQAMKNHAGKFDCCNIM